MFSCLLYVCQMGIEVTGICIILNVTSDPDTIVADTLKLIEL